jgi:hypothetical protein
MVRAVLAAICMIMTNAVQATPPTKTLDFDDVAREVQRYFATQSDHREGDLIRQSQIDAVLKNVAATGWKVDNSQEIVALGLPDGSFLVRELSSPSGKKFMRKIAAQPGGYSHLDRLSTTPRGQQTVRDLIRTPGGDDMIKYLTTTKGGRKLGTMMDGVRHGVDLNKPTGRIYTANDLVAVLKKLHDEASR